MKIAHIADIHIADNRIDEFEILLDQLGDQIIESNPDLVVFAGDMFTHRDKLSPKQVQLTRWFFKSKLEKYPKILIPGNHDASMSAIKKDSLVASFVHDDIKVYEKIGEHVDIGGIRFHMFPYPSRSELDRLGLKDINDLNLIDPSSMFEFGPNKNILIFHGTLQGFAYTEEYKASEESIGVGHELIIKKEFWERFDATFAGHLHKRQKIKNAVYPGCPFPLTFADEGKNGWALWDINTEIDCNLKVLEPKFPYMTFDAGNIQIHKTSLTEHVIRDLNISHYDFTNARVRVKYTIPISQSKEIDHIKLGQAFPNAKEVKIVPTYIKIDSTGFNASIDDFKADTVGNIIKAYIIENQYNDGVMSLADHIEKKLSDLYSADDEKGIHFALNKLRIKNFKPFGEELEEINFDKLPTVVGIFGKNYTGKSALLESIAWVLFGKTTRNKLAETVIRNGQNFCSVELELTSHRVKYKIVRIQSHNSSLNLYCKVDGTWMDISESDKRATQKAIEKIVGSFEMFISTIYSPQNQIDLLIDKTPSERKQIILDCLQVDVLVRRQEYIKNIKAKTKEEEQITKGRFLAFSEKLENLIASNPSKIIEEYSEVLKNKKIERDVLSQKINNLRTKLLEYEDYKKEYNKIDSELSQVRKEIQELTNERSTKMLRKDSFEGYMNNRHLVEDGLKRLALCTEEVERFKAEKETLVDLNNQINTNQKKKEDEERQFNSQISLLRDSQKQIMNQISGFTELDCPKPDCPLNQKISLQRDDLRIQADRVGKDIESKLVEKDLTLSDYDNVISSLSEMASKSTYDTKEYTKAVLALSTEEQKKWPELQAKLASGGEILNSMLEVIAAINHQLEDKRKYRDVLVDRRTMMAEKIATVQNYDDELNLARINLNEANNKIEQYETQIFKSKQAIEDIEVLTDQVKSENKKLEDLAQKINDCDKYSEIVGKKGVVFTLVDKALPILQDFSQRLLSETTNGSISISIESFKKLVSGQYVEDVNILITDAKGSRDISEGSGAEKMLSSLALRAGMAHLLSLRMGSHVELFVIDEGMGALDDDNILVVKDMFRKLGEKFNKILFITHITELKDIADASINVYSKDRISNYNITGVLDESD